MKINIHTSHPSAFISSTFIDLYDDRMAVADVLRNRGLNINALDVKPASNQTSKMEIMSGIKESDFLILLVGDRFGSILKSMTGSESISITWWEYNTARKMGKPVHVYFKDVNPQDKASHDEIDASDYSRKRRRFNVFKRMLTSRHNPAYYSDLGTLASKIDNSLISIYRQGVKDLMSKNVDLNSKVSELENQIASYNTANFSSSNSNPGLRGLYEALENSPPTGGLEGLLRKK